MHGDSGSSSDGEGEGDGGEGVEEAGEGRRRPTMLWTEVQVPQRQVAGTRREVGEVRSAGKFVGRWERGMDAGGNGAAVGSGRYDIVAVFDVGCTIEVDVVKK